MDYEVNHLFNHVFNHLSRSGIVDQPTLDNWLAVLREAMGSVEVIHGDSHLLNVLKTGVDSVAWIDAMLVPNSDRMDDIGYALSYMIQKDVSENVSKGVNPTDIIRTVTENAYNVWGPSVLESYNATVNLKTLYKYSPIDFFVGAHCIIRSDLWDEANIKWCLNEIGKYFMTQWPINKVIGLV